MNTETKYQVSVGVQSWDSRQNAFVTNDLSAVTGPLPLEEAKAEWLKQWEKREELAAENRAPVVIELNELEFRTEDDGTVLTDVLDTYSSEPCPNGDPSWCGYYDGKDMTGKYVLWAIRTGNGHEKPYDLNCFDTIGYVQKKYGLSTGEWALRHCDDRAGARYAEAFFDTPEAMAEYFYTDVDDRFHTQERLTALAGHFTTPFTHASTLPVVQATYERGTNGGLFACATLPDGTEWEQEVKDGDLEHETLHAFDANGALVAIQCGEIAEELNEEENA